MRDPTYLDSYRGPTVATAERSNLLGKVFGLLAFSMAFTAVGAVVGLQLGPGAGAAGHDRDDDPLVRARLRPQRPRA